MVSPWSRNLSYLLQISCQCYHPEGTALCGRHHLSSAPPKSCTVQHHLPPSFPHPCISPPHPFFSAPHTIATMGSRGVKMPICFQTLKVQKSKHFILGSWNLRCGKHKVSVPRKVGEAGSCMNSRVLKGAMWLIEQKGNVPDMCPGYVSDPLDTRHRGQLQLPVVQGWRRPKFPFQPTAGCIDAVF